MANSTTTTTPASQEAFLAALNYWASGAARRDIAANDAADARELALYRADRAYDTAHAGFGEAC